MPNATGRATYSGMKSYKVFSDSNAPFTMSRPAAPAAPYSVFVSSELQDCEENAIHFFKESPDTSIAKLNFYSHRLDPETLASPGC